MKEIFKYNNFTVYKDGFMYYFSDGKNEYNFIPYKVNGEKTYSKGKSIFDLSDFIKYFNEYCKGENIEDVLDIIHKNHIEDVSKAWDNIEYIENLKLGQDEKEKSKEEKSKRKRKVRIPLQCCKSIAEIPLNEEIDTIKYYNVSIDKHEYLVDIISTKQKHFYVGVTDITNGYEEIDFYEFKNKYCQPTLFDDFFDI